MGRCLQYMPHQEAGSIDLALARRLQGARRARGTSLCPGRILLFGHVKILFLSLLSKSVPIKGREARPGRERGRAGMPRSTKNSQASGAAASSSAAGDEVGWVDDEERKEPSEREKKRAPTKRAPISQESGPWQDRKTN